MWLKAGSGRQREIIGVVFAMRGVMVKPLSWCVRVCVCVCGWGDMKIEKMENIEISKVLENM